MSLPRPAVARASSWSPLEAEEARAFLQRRLALLGRTLFSILLGFCGVTALLTLPSIDPRSTGWALDPGAAALAANTVAALVLWLYCRRGDKSLGVLRALDAAFVFLVCSLFSLLALVPNPSDVPGDPPSWAALAFTNVVIAHAVVVPSTPRRTLILTVLAALPTVATSYLSYHSRTSEPGMTLFLTAWGAAWCTSAAVGAAVASRVIYGLREQVREARRLGQYRLEEKIGEGGMGVVYRASHAMLRRPTAIKLLPTDRAGADRIGRFEREVQLTSQLTHPNTVAVFDYGRTVDGVFYYAMEYLEGLNLDELIRLDGAQPPGRVVHIMRQIAGSLAEAHDVGLIHRDIKPGNVILVPQRGGVSDVAKVVDFGLAKDLGPGGVDLTREDVIAGTPSYLAPEAIRSPEVVDARADIYALGAVGYFLLTGTQVFTGRNAVEIFGHHLHTRASAPEERLGHPTSARLASLIMDCLEKEPARRPRSASAVADALDTCDDASPWTAALAREWWSARAPSRRSSPSAEPGQETAITISRLGSTDRR